MIIPIGILPVTEGELIEVEVPVVLCDKVCQVSRTRFNIADLRFFWSRWLRGICVNNAITPISLPLFPPVRSTVPLSRNRGSATRIGGKHKDKVLYRGIGGV